MVIVCKKERVNKSLLYLYATKPLALLCLYGTKLLNLRVRGEERVGLTTNKCEVGRVCFGCVKREKERKE